MTDHEKRIREALEAGPTEGVWNWDCAPVKGDPLGRTRYRVTTVGKAITQVYYSSYEGGPTNAGQDAAFIAACNPSAIRALLADLDNERRENNLRKDLVASGNELVNKLNADLDAVRGALEKLCGTADDPHNGWRGTGGTDVLLACEYCGAKHEDCTKIEHTDSCPIPTARAALKGATA